MILEFLGAVSAASLIVLVGLLLVLAAENRKKYKFFEENAPGLRVAENPSLFGGHSNQLIHAKYNWASADEAFEKYACSTVGLYFDTRPSVVTKDLDFIKTFALDEQMHINRLKPCVPWKEFEEDCIMFAEDEQWVKLRKAIAPAFAAHKIKTAGVRSEVASLIDKVVGLIERQLDTAQQQRQQNFIDIDIDDICHRFALAFVFKCFYKQDNVIDFQSPSKDKWVEMLDTSLGAMNGPFMKACAAFPSIKPFINWLVLNFDVLGRMRNTIMNFIKEQTKNNFEAAKQAGEISSLSKTKGTSNEAGRDFDADNFTLRDGSKFKRNMLDYIVDQYRAGKLTESEYFNSTGFLFHAANKTTSDVFSRCLYSLAHHPDIQSKVRDSIEASGEESEYLSWVINETLRLSPPAPIGCSRIIKRDIQTKDGLVPAGTFVITPARTINRLKEYWGPDADKFRPERWADTRDFHPAQYLSFGAGRRGCPGKELALMELKMALCELLRRYKFDRSEIYPLDNSNHFSAPLFTFLVYDTPSHVKISRIESGHTK